MGNLLDLIDKRIEQKINGQNSITYTPATVVSVREDYLRADVKLLAGGTVLKNMLNKTGEKLTVGQDVKVAYLTLPSAGWVALTNGEADPLKSGEVGGDVWNIATAAILNDDNFDNFVIANEEMAELSPTTQLYYGATPAFIVLQGMLCYFGAGKHSAGGVSPPTLDGSAEKFQMLMDNLDYFSPTTYGSMTDPEHSLMAIPYSSSNTAVYYFSLTISSYSVTKSWQNNVGERLTQILRYYPSNWKFDSGSKPTELIFFDDLTAAQQGDVRANGVIGTWREVSNVQGAVYEGTSLYLSKLASDFAIIPCVTSFSAATTYNGYATPYGYATVTFLTVANGVWAQIYSTSDGIPLSSVATTGVMPFASQAELDFALGLTRRSEPVQEVGE